MADEFKRIMAFFNLSPEEKEGHLQEVFEESFAYFERFKHLIETGTLEEKKEAVERALALKKKIEEETKQILEKTGMSEEELVQFSENPQNFSESQWKVIENAKQELQEVVEGIGQALKADEFKRIMAFFELDPEEKKGRLQEVFEDSFAYLKHLKNVLKTGTVAQKKEATEHVLTLQKHLEEEIRQSFKQTGMDEKEIAQKLKTDEFKRIMSVFQLSPKEKEGRLQEVFEDSFAYFTHLKDVIKTGSLEHKKEAIERVFILKNRIEEEVHKILQKTGMSAKEIAEFASNPENFSKSQWRAIEGAKQHLQGGLEGTLQKFETEKGDFSKQQKVNDKGDGSKKKRKKRQDWMSS